MSEMEASVSHLFNKQSIERANTLLLLGILVRAHMRFGLRSPRARILAGSAKVPLASARH